MLFGKLFAGFAFAAIAIAPVACAPTAEPEVSVVEKRTTIGDYARTCHTNVQQHCSNINKHISGNGGVITVDVTAQINVELQGIVDEIIALLAQVKVYVFVSADFEDCVPVWVSIVQLLTTLFITISGACTGGAIAELASLCLSINVQITLCSNLLLSSITSLISGLVGLLVGLLGDVLNGLVVNINASLTAFTSACAPFNGY